MKKMRRLIPAVAMLMVAAVMLSTASFAWFTMNETVEATGMTVQAKSDGSLVIDTVPLTSLSTGWEAKFAPLGNHKLSPVSYGEYIPSTADAQGNPVAGDKAATGWFDAFDAKKVDPTTGESIHFKAATPGNSNCVDYTVYIGLASETQEKNIQVDLASLSELYITGAYAVAFYVDTNINDNVPIDLTAAPALLLHCAGGTANVDAEKTGLLFDAPVTIPSTVGVSKTDDSDGVGIKVVMRVFIDGNLKDGKTFIPKKPTYKKAEGKYDPTKSYFVTKDEGVTFENATINENDYIDADNNYKDVSGDWYVFDTYIDDKQNAKDTYFVNNSYAPNAPSALNVTFKLVDTTKTPAQGGEEAGE